MLIQFKKYKINDGQTKLYNYFDKANPNKLEDILMLTRLPLNGFPTFTDEVTDTADFFQWQAADYEMWLGYSATTKSAEGKTVKEFFDAELEDRKILCTFEFGSGENKQTRAGFVDIETIDKDFNTTDEGQGVKLSIIYGTRELVDHLQTLELPELSGNPDYEQTIRELLDVFNTGLLLNNQLYYMNRLGWDREPVLSLPLYNCIKKWLNRWQGFEALAKEHGWAYYLTYDITTDKWTMKLFWRSQISNTATIKIIKHNEGYMWQTKTWLFFENRYSEEKSYFNDDVNVSHGLLMKKAFNWATDSRQGFYNLPQFHTRCEFTSGEVWDNYIAHYQTPIEVTTIKPRDKEVLEPGTDMHEFNLQSIYGPMSMLSKMKYGSIKVSRLFVYSYGIRQAPDGKEYYEDDGFSGSSSLAMQLILFEEYQFLLRGLKRKLKLRVAWDENYNIGLFNKFQYIRDGVTKEFWICRITNLNLIERTCDIEAVEF
jgi:hypothetical protein